MNKYVFPLLVLATMFVADYANSAGKNNAPAGGMPEKSQAAANSNGIRSADRDKGLERAAERRNSHSVVKTHGHKGKPKKTKVARSR